MQQFIGKYFVVRIDAATALDADSTFVGDMHFLAASELRPIVVAPDPPTARNLVRALNRSGNTALTLGGSDAGMIPQGPEGIGIVQVAILQTLTGAGYIPVIEPTAFAVFGACDVAVVADEVAASIASATEAVRAVFCHVAGGVVDPQTQTLVEQLTPAEALTLADDGRLPMDMSATVRAAARGVRAGVSAAQIVDGRLAHATIVELLTMHHLGTQVSGGVVLTA
ncbi:MAG: amino acid kinase family protein [Vulcanimicrobiaceae bacterium]